MEKIRTAAKMLCQAKHTVVFTGAGVSVESGIPTFRGEGGVWEKYDPQKVAGLRGFRKDPRHLWDFLKDLLKPQGEPTVPNAGHYALASIEAQGLIRSIITQNIDGLHQEAGSSRVLELHGTLRRLHCLECFWQGEMGKTIPSPYPSCPNCGSNLVKPQIVLFGEALPEKIMMEAEEEVCTCDLFIVIGSSLEVFPAAALPLMAKRNNAKLILINRDPISNSEIFDLSILGTAGNILPLLKQEIEKAG